MLVLAGLEAGLPAAQTRVRRALDRGEGLDKLRQIVEAQGGDPAVLDDYDRLPSAPHTWDWPAPDDGVVTGLDARHVGWAAVLLGAGRDRADGAIHPGVGIEVIAPVGAAVRRGDPVLRLRYEDEDRLEAAREALSGALTLADVARPPDPLVLEVIHA
jgi:thymidine phosphorylase